jgi:hypothetical protein
MFTILYGGITQTTSQYCGPDLDAACFINILRSNWRGAGKGNASRQARADLSQEKLRGHAQAFYVKSPIDAGVEEN